MMFFEFVMVLSNNNNIYLTKGQLHQRGKCPSKLAILKATKPKKQQKKTEKKKNCATDIWINLSVQ